MYRLNCIYVPHKHLLLNCVDLIYSAGKVRGSRKMIEIPEKFRDENGACAAGSWSDEAYFSRTAFEIEVAVHLPAFHPIPKIDKKRPLLQPIPFHKCGTPHTAYDKICPAEQFFIKKIAMKNSNVRSARRKPFRNRVSNQKTAADHDRSFPTELVMDGTHDCRNDCGGRRRNKNRTPKRIYIFFGRNRSNCAVTVVFFWKRKLQYDSSNRTVSI